MNSRPVLSAADIARARKQIENGHFGELFDADDALAALSSHENLRAAFEDALRRAAGHAYATAMAEGGEEIQHQELAAERRSHGETLAELRRVAEAARAVVAAYQFGAGNPVVLDRRMDDLEEALNADGGKGAA